MPEKTEADDNMINLAQVTELLCGECQEQSSTHTDQEIQEEQNRSDEDYVFQQGYDSKEILSITDSSTGFVKESETRHAN
ncbi:hypothetical protein JCM33374_g6177 [Metschnikowia sp. JCM 33374]|nr:hypothetical protein JCM33374_g6177 [Metschnikowia sp. JCM 33374]